MTTNGQPSANESSPGARDGRQLVKSRLTRRFWIHRFFFFQPSSASTTNRPRVGRGAKRSTLIFFSVCKSSWDMFSWETTTRGKLQNTSVMILMIMILIVSLQSSCSTHRKSTKSQTGSNRAIRILEDNYRLNNQSYRLLCDQLWAICNEYEYMYTEPTNL
jgi:hypothetical protein